MYHCYFSLVFVHHCLCVQSSTLRLFSYLPTEKKISEFVLVTTCMNMFDRVASHLFWKAMMDWYATWIPVQFRNLKPALHKHWELTFQWSEKGKKGDISLVTDADIILWKLQSTCIFWNVLHIEGMSITVILNDKIYKTLKNILQVTGNLIW